MKNIAGISLFEYLVILQIEYLYLSLHQMHICMKRGATTFKHIINYLNIQKELRKYGWTLKSQHVKIGFWQDLTNARFWVTCCDIGERLWWSYASHMTIISNVILIAWVLLYKGREFSIILSVRHYSVLCCW